jgi:hypothetical protein
VTATEGIALAATIGVPMVAGLAIVANVLNSRGERKHARELARSDRWFDMRRQVYEELLGGTAQPKGWALLSIAGFYRIAAMLHPPHVLGSFAPVARTPIRPSSLSRSG